MKTLVNPVKHLLLPGELLRFNSLMQGYQRSGKNMAELNLDYEEAVAVARVRACHWLKVQCALQQQTDVLILEEAMRLRFNTTWPLVKKSHKLHKLVPVFLAGFIRDSDSESSYKCPGLGNLIYHKYCEDVLVWLLFNHKGDPEMDKGRHITVEDPIVGIDMLLKKRTSPPPFPRNISLTVKDRLYFD